MKYRMYIDEVGNSDLKSSENPLHRFLSLTGVIIDLEYISEILFLDIENLKVKYFKSHPDDPIILHRKELVNAKYPFKALKDEKIKKQFDKELLSLLKKWEYSVITVCLDKKIHKDTYKVWRYDPYHYCLALLLERYTFFLEQKQKQGDVMAESRGGKEDKRLKASFLKLWNEGTQFISQERFHEAFTSKQLKVKPKSNNISGLQLADLIAHPSRNEILSENKLLDKPLAPFAKKIIKILQSKYYQHNGMIFGKKCI
ncbi:MAG: DUF3800 domain-containing protein [Thermodesulfobacteriota bacterium]|nr:DUF3800 domain-containing protein [Thermodesulfobacteriota bacterium]